MRKRNDIFEMVKAEYRPQLIRKMITDVVGKEHADEIFPQLVPLYDPELCQPGDCRRAEDNYWGGRWQVYRADEASRR